MIQSRNCLSTTSKIIVIKIKFKKISKKDVLYIMGYSSLLGLDNDDSWCITFLKTINHFISITILSKASVQHNIVYIVNIFNHF